MRPDRVFALKAPPSFRELPKPFAHGLAPPQDAEQDVGGTKQEKRDPKQMIEQIHILRFNVVQEKERNADDETREICRKALFFS